MASLSSRAPWIPSLRTGCKAAPAIPGRRFIRLHSVSNKTDEQSSDFSSSSNAADDGLSSISGSNAGEDALINAGAADPRRELERFAIRDSGKYQCRSCGYVYDQAAGDPSYPVPPGVEFSKLPEDWRCATCGASKSYFLSLSVEIAGFAENQNYGFGTNTLTSAQKSVLIYGSLFAFFALFLSGYFLQ